MRCCDCEFRNRCDETEKVLTSFVKCYKRDRLLKEQKTQTNADKIRSMTDEELAEMFLIREGTERHINPRRDFLPLFYAPDGTCCRDRNYALQLWIEWLKQPAEED